jgi:GNAT superfamily N-acetyltransferase
MTLPPTIRVIRDSDWPAIDRIQRECFPPSAIESREVLQSLSQHSPGSCLIAETDSPLGYVLAHPWIPADLPPIKASLPPIPANASCLFFHDLAITPAARGTGLAHRLVEEVLAWARQRGLAEGSLVSVQESRRFWARYGFEEDPALTERFRETVGQLYGLDFAFMTARWAD